MSESPQPVLRRLVPPSLADDAHKGDAGRIFGLCGSRTMPGAAVLVARAAQRAGAGLVTLGCLEPELLRVVPAAVPEAVYVDLSALDQWPIFLASRSDHALVVGPGLGQGPRAAAALEGLLACGRRGPVVLDADALNLLASQRGGLARLNAATILTPHPGEAQRLLGRSVGAEADQRREAALELARASGAVVVLKGRHSVVAQGSQVYVNDTGNWGMATAGSGDVLSGIAAAYAALCATGQHSGWTPFDAAAAAVRVHGLAGDLAAAHLGRRALIASDLIGYLPAAQKRLEAAAT